MVKMAKKRNSGLGLGLDALIKEKTVDNQTIKKNQTSKKPETLSTNVSKVQNQKEDEELLKSAIFKEVEKNPRITLWSQKSSAVLRYLKKTQPEFSISKEASLLIDEAVKNKYPEIWELFDDS